MKAEWKKSKCSAASSHPNKAILTIFSLVAEYFLQPPRTLYACYTPLSTLNSDFQCQEYFMNGYTAVQKRNEATDILKWHQAEFLGKILGNLVLKISAENTIIVHLLLTTWLSQ
jgi:hypothetical protein